MPAMPEKPRITVAIATRNRAAFLEKAIASVLPQLNPGDELLIIDNASTDDTPRLASKFAQADQRIRVFREEILGLSAGRNTAHRHARSDYVLFLDDDAIVKSGWVDAYVQFIQSHPGEKIGAIAGACIPQYETPPPAWHNQKSDWLDLGDAAHPLPRGTRTPGGGNCAYNTAAVLAVGGFCNDLKRAEDTDMYLRLQEAGYEIWWLPGAPIYHFISKKRLDFWNLARAAFFEGRAYARVRVRERKTLLARERYRLIRVLASFPYAAWYLLSALLTIPFQHGRLAARAFQRALRVAGMAWQMVADLANRKSKFS
jgi:glycosyltransferase involved in cell wall biosynthesis